MNGELNRCWTLDDFAQLIELLRADGRIVIGPTLREGVIAYSEIGSIADLPRGRTDAQAPGRYHLDARADDALFGFACGPQSFKPYFLPPRLKLLTIRRTNGALAVEEAPPESRPLALIGARGCDLAAIAVQDRALNVPGFAEPHYAARRSDVFVVAVECGEPRDTCFCVSLGTGPGVTTGFDIAVTEVLEAAGGHRFVARAGSDAGETMLERVGGREAWTADLEAAAATTARAKARMARTLDTTGLPELLQESRSHAQWDDVATRCMGCGNCTMVCPTCFCTTMEDVTDLAGGASERVRRWDSCFTLGFSYVAGGSVRPSVAARYRQWLTHKLSSWRTQYGVMGCVGCGRCITWCPAGIDITREAAAIRDGSHRPGHPVAEVPR